MAIDRLANLPAGADVFLDANIFIYSFGGQSNECRDLLRRCATEDVFGITTLEVKFVASGFRSIRNRTS